MYLHNGGAANCGGPICLSMLAGRRAADKEGLDRLFNSGTIFPEPSASRDGEKKEKKEEQEKKGSGGEKDSDANKKKEKESADPSHQTPPEEADKPLEEGAAKPESDGKKSEPSGSDNNSHEEEVKRPDTTPFYAACWSTGAHRPGFFEEIKERWWSSSSGNSSAFCGSTDPTRSRGNGFGVLLHQPSDLYIPTKKPAGSGFPSLGLGLLESQKYLAEWQIKDNIISAKAESIRKQDPEYIKLEESKKRLVGTPESKFLGNIMNLGFGKIIKLGLENMAFDNASSMVNTLNHQGIKTKEKIIKIRCYRQAEEWYKAIERRKKVVGEEKNNPPWPMQKDYQITIQEEKNDLRKKEEEIRALSIEKLKSDITEERDKLKIYPTPFEGCREEYSRAPVLLEPAKNLLSSVKTDKIIESVSVRYGKAGEIAGYSLIYIKDKVVERLDQFLEKNKQYNLKVDGLYAAAAREVLDEYFKAKASNFIKKKLKQDMNGFNDTSSSSGVIRSNATGNEPPALLLDVSKIAD